VSAVHAAYHLPAAAPAGVTPAAQAAMPASNLQECSECQVHATHHPVPHHSNSSYSNCWRDTCSPDCDGCAPASHLKECAEWQYM
jgi:hypothetical protein